MEKIIDQKEYYDDIFDCVDMAGCTLGKITVEGCQFIDCDFSEAVFNQCLNLTTKCNALS